MGKEGFKGKNRKKKSSARRNTKAYKRVDPYWQENPDKLNNKLKAAHKKKQELQEKRKAMNPGTTNEKLRKKAIKGLVKKHGKEVNQKVWKEEEEFRENKLKYERLSGESMTMFRQRMQDDCDVAMAEANLEKQKDKKKEKDGLLKNDLDFTKMIRTELLETNRIKETKQDRREKKLDGLKNAKQRNREEEKAKKKVEKLDKQLETAEKEYKTDKVEFGERVDDIFKTKFVPKGVKQNEKKNGNFGKVNGIGSGKRKFGGLLLSDKLNEFGLGFKNAENKSKVGVSKHRQKEINDERARVIEAYREMKQ